MKKVLEENEMDKRKTLLQQIKEEELDNENKVKGDFNKLE